VRGGGFERALVRALHALPPERAHRLAIRALRLVPARPFAPDPRLETAALGLRFAHPVGLAGGFDKNGEAVAGFLRLGFAFVEIGTVTPRPQRGNPVPRLFRSTADRAFVNRLGFNNEGADAVARRLEAFRTGGRAGIVGVNIGANADSADRAADYAEGVRRLGRLADYLAVNVSSPNTPGLRELQGPAALDRLLARILEARAGLEEAASVPILLKIAPDLDRRGLADIVATALRHRIDGLIVSNTTIARPELAEPRLAAEPGGLSGLPLFERSTALVARARQLAGPNLTIVGVGGVGDAETAWAKIAAGADLVQLYTSLVFEGPFLPRRLAPGLAERLEKRGLDSIAQARGIEMERWAAAWEG